MYLTRLNRFAGYEPPPGVRVHRIGDGPRNPEEVKAAYRLSQEEAIRGFERWLTETPKEQAIAYLETYSLDPNEGSITQLWFYQYFPNEYAAFMRRIETARKRQEKIEAAQEYLRTHPGFWDLVFPPKP